MRKYKIIILSMMLIISATSLFGQETVAVVTAKSMNVLYAGVPNPISIKSSISPEKLSISWGGAIAKEIADKEYEVDVPSSFVDKEITISISQKLENGEMKEISSTAFRVKSIPEPTIIIGEDISSGRQGKDAILANPFISVKMPADFPYDLDWQVLSYRVVFVKNGMEEAPIMAKGAKFTELIIERIQNAPSGTMIEFSDIHIQSIAGTRTFAIPLIIRIQ